MRVKRVYVARETSRETVKCGFSMAEAIRSGSESNERSGQSENYAVPYFFQGFQADPLSNSVEKDCELVRCIRRGKMCLEPITKIVDVDEDGSLLVHVHVRPSRSRSAPHENRA